MNYKSTLVEENINILKNNITLFYGENLGLKSDLKSQIKKRNRGSEVFDFYQEDILKNENLIFERIFNKSLFNETKIFPTFVINLSSRYLIFKLYRIDASFTSSICTMLSYSSVKMFTRDNVE